MLRRLCAGGDHNEIARAKSSLLDHGAQPLTENALDTVARNGTADLFGYGETDTVDLCLLRVLTARRTAILTPLMMLMTIFTIISR